MSTLPTPLTTLLTTLPSPYILIPLLLTLYLLLTLLRPLLALHHHYTLALPTGLPIKLAPLPPGLPSFFLHLFLTRLHLSRPGTKIHGWLNVGRPEGYGMHREMGDVFLLVSPAGMSMVVADPEVVAQVSGNRERFPKPPNTGAIINLYGRNVINADGDTWRFHRRVTGRVFSEKIHASVWQEGQRQAGEMVRYWLSSSSSSASSASSSPSDSSGPSLAPNGAEELKIGDSIRVDSLFDDTLRLALNIITSSAYSFPLSFPLSSSSSSFPPSSSSPLSSSSPSSNPNPNPPTLTPHINLTFSQSVEELNKHLMPLFLTPRWVLRVAPGWTGWGRAWRAYVGLGGYLGGMLERERGRRVGGWGDLPTSACSSSLGAAADGTTHGMGEKLKDQEEEEEDGKRENLLTALLDAEDFGDEKEGSGRRMTREEVMGNAFIFMFAGHETTANTTHYALLLLALHPHIQSLLLHELDTLLTLAQSQSRPLSYAHDFPRAIFTQAVMNETLRLYSPTSVVNKWTCGDQVVQYGGKEVVVPGGVRVAVNITGVHASPKVWGEDAGVWKPERWLVPIPISSSSGSSTPTPTPNGRTMPSPEQAAHQGEEKPQKPIYETYTLLRPPRGTFLPFSEGSRQCSGKKFATVEFVSVLFSLLSDYRIEILGEDEGWGEERVRRVLRGRKAGALTLQVPERVPVRFVRRK